MSIATELTALSNNLSNAYNAIDNKGGTIPANKNTANLADAINSISGGGSVVVTNGQIKQYKALSSNIDANTFVNLLNTVVVGTYANMTTLTSSYNSMKAAKIGSDKVFVIFRVGANLYGVVCTISGTTTTVGTYVQLASDAQTSSPDTSVTTLEEDKVFVAYPATDYFPKGIVCTVSGTTVTPGTSVTLLNESATSDGMKSVALDSGRVMVTHRKGNYINAMVCTITGTTITPGTDIQLSNGYVGYNGSSITLLDTNKVFVAYRNNNHLYSMVCTISDTTITPGTETELSTLTYSYDASSCVTLNSSKVFIAHRGADNALNGMVCTISGTTITHGADTPLSPYTGSYLNASAAALSSNKVFVAHQGGVNSSLGYLYGASCFIEGTSIIIGDYRALDTSSYASTSASAVALDADRVFVVHRKSSYAAGNACSISDLLATEATGTIRGLTSTQCTTSTAGDVWVLNS